MTEAFDNCKWLAAVQVFSLSFVVSLPGRPKKKDEKRKDVGGDPCGELWPPDVLIWQDAWARSGFLLIK